MGLIFRLFSNLSTDFPQNVTRENRPARTTQPAQPVRRPAREQKPGRCRSSAVGTSPASSVGPVPPAVVVPPRSPSASAQPAGPGRHSMSNLNATSRALAVARPSSRAPPPYSCSNLRRLARLARSGRPGPSRPGPAPRPPGRASVRVEARLPVRGREQEAAFPAPALPPSLPPSLHPPPIPAPPPSGSRPAFRRRPLARPPFQILSSVAPGPPSRFPLPLRGRSGAGDRGAADFTNPQIQDQTNCKPFP